MKKLKLSTPYCLTKLYQYGEDDNFHYWYYRNKNIFKNNDFYVETESDFYKDELYTIEEDILKDAGILTIDNNLIIPRGTHSLKIVTEKRGDVEYKGWELAVNGVVLNIKILIDNTFHAYEENEESVRNMVIC